mmetsp:Transcript_6561/g.16549  ORF Transcript_6561/g.16549 Transcript_6561/m.16549 type:complete len:238 (+) Transcript_6561:25-738(+)|eukprot:CAMPEP_0177636588 /NCGR_PEP_ID=MMETSP0447-20121125/4518_1 /TAXON_ID=0 /ORGANISM="Stygamoeba regulata, Strain BSH-02190019" /LENGTH=237 /DNA_ID=CAMNT_0019138459 /DNA_START=18 /DNA_END=731 /DNA_ORIENTATION=+
MLEETKEGTTGGDEELAFLPSTTSTAPSYYESPDTSTAAPSAVHTISAPSIKGIGWLFEIDDEDDDEPQGSLLEELDIDIPDIMSKLRAVTFPFWLDRAKLLESPDFWGPMMVVVCYCLLLSWGSIKVISWVMSMWFYGSFLIFLLVRVLGGDISYSQCLGVIGYSVFPLLLTVMAAFIANLGHQTDILLFLKCIGTLWSSYSAASILLQEKLSSRKPLLVYPILLLYIYLIALFHS